jgi:hypothetical protein
MLSNSDDLDFNAPVAVPPAAPFSIHLLAIKLTRSSLITYFRAKRWYFFNRQGRTKARNSGAISAEPERSLAIKDQASQSERGYETASKFVSWPPERWRWAARSPAIIKNARPWFLVKMKQQLLHRWRLTEYRITKPSNCISLARESDLAWLHESQEELLWWIIAPYDDSVQSRSI